jgi:hypothetical protein
VRRRLLIVTTAGVVAIAAWASGFPGWLTGSTVESSPAPSSAETPGPSPLSSPAASTAASSTPVPSSPARATDPLGAQNDAVVVRPIGDRDRPDLEVSLITLDAGAFETNLQPRLIATLPGSAIPEETVVSLPNLSYGQAGWLAIDAVAATAIAPPSMLIFDLRAPDAVPWQIPGRVLSSSWGPDSVLAVPGDAEIHLYDPSSRVVSTVAIPDGVRVRDDEADPDAPVTWLARGSGFLAWQGAIDRQLGRLDRDTGFIPSDVPPVVFQARGLERRWGADGSELSYGCPTEGGPEGCSISTALDGGPPTVWFTEGAGSGTVMDHLWDATGEGVWLLIEHVGGEGPVTYTLTHADAPDEWLDVATTPLDQPGDGGLAMLGIGDDTGTLDDQHILVGPPGAYAQVAISGDGAIAPFEPDTWFAGWAADQGPYPLR